MDRALGMRDKVIGMLVVLAVAALVVWVASKSREHPAERPAAIDAQAASEPVDAGAIEDAAIVDVTGEDATLDESPACAAMRAASAKQVDEAKDAGFCLSWYGELECKTEKNGATWGVRIDDVTDLEPDAAACPTGWLERVVHVAPDGSEQSMIPPGPGGVRNGHRYNVYKNAPVGIVSFFDWDGDGDDEVVVQRWNNVFVWTFKKGRIVQYAPAAGLTVDEVKDVDGDGRPDLLVRPFGDAPPTSIELLAHALPDGAFTVRDALAVQRAQTACPKDEPVSRDVDDENLANAIACALLWGHDASSLRKDLCMGDAGPCPPWVRQMLWTKPLLTLR